MVAGLPTLLETVMTTHDARGALTDIAKSAWDEAWQLAFNDGLGAGHPLGRSFLDREKEWAQSEVLEIIDRQKDSDSATGNGDGMALMVATDALIALLPGPYYMDPPDGGSVTVLEQLQRMAQDAARYRWLRDSDRVGDEMEGDILVGAEGGEDVLWGKFMDRAIDAAMAGDPTPDTEIEDLFEGRAANTAVISANGAVNSRAEIIARAVQAHGRAWPEQLTSGVMFYEGERITKAEFLAEVRG